MIRINLLPQELRQAARTPVKLFATVLIGAGLLTVLLCTYAYLWFNVIVFRERCDRKRDEIQHPFLDERVTVGLLWHIQAQLLARHLRGDLDAYPPFVWR